MSSENPRTYEYIPFGDGVHAEPIIVAALAPEPPEETPPPPQASRRRVRLPVVLFVLTCLSTFLVGGLLRRESLETFLLAGFQYSAALMTILICHEAGHFFQACRYRVPASLPFFIPMPISPIGTMGAVIGMGSNMGDRRTLFDIGITGPLAGLVPTVILCIVGLYWSDPVTLPKDGTGFLLGEPLLFKGLSSLISGPLGEGRDILLHPVGFAGWVGLLITALNLMPIGQLDGGHILYGLLRKKAHAVASLLLLAAMVAVFLFEYWGWSLMLMLLVLMGPKHPPTANDNVSLGVGRTILGWLTLAFVPIGFTPMPFIF